MTILPSMIELWSQRNHANSLYPPACVRRRRATPSSWRPCVSWASSSPTRPLAISQKAPEAALLEVTVAGERVGEAVLLHHDERDAIGQRPFLVRA